MHFLEMKKLHTAVFWYVSESNWEWKCVYEKNHHYYTSQFLKWFFKKTSTQLSSHSGHSSDILWIYYNVLQLVLEFPFPISIHNL